MALRDPEHVPERLLLNVSGRLAASCAKWAEQVKAGADDVSEVAGKAYWRTVYVARLNGAIAGTPFFIALVPAYLVFLEQEYRFFMMAAALAGKDPASLEVGADFLVLRGVYDSHSDALDSLRSVKESPMPEPTGRRPLRYWYDSVMSILVYAGFLSPPEQGAETKHNLRWLLRLVGNGVFAGLIWIFTWVFPLSFMVLMSWTCEHDARSLGQKTLDHWKLEASSKKSRTERRAERREQAWKTRAFNLIRGLIFIVTLAVPLALVGGSIMNQRWSFGWDLPETTGALAGLALVIGVVVTTYSERSRVH